MNPPAMDMESLGERLSRLERENRWLKRVGGVALLGVAAMVLMGQATPRKTAKAIEAEEFILRDGTGKERATMRVSPDGSPSLGLVDKDGKKRVALLLGADGLPNLWLWDKNGKERAGLELLADGLPRLALRDEKERRRAVLGHTELEHTRTGTVEQQPASSLVLFDKDEKVLWRAP